MLVDQEEDSGWSTVWNGGHEVGSKKWGDQVTQDLLGPPKHLGSSCEGQRSLEMRTTWQDLSSRPLWLPTGVWAGGVEQKSLELVKQGQVGRVGVAQSLHLQPRHTEGPGN